jgi:hypothetical protein
LTCTIVADGYATRSIDVKPYLKQHEVILNRSRQVKGRIITSSGQPIADARISDALSRAVYGNTDDRGGFLFRIADDRNVLIVASANGYVEKRIQVGENEQDLTITLYSSDVRGGVYGRVLDPAGIPIWKYLINIRSRSGFSEDQIGYESRVVENIDGVFVITDLPEGTFLLDFIFKAHDEHYFGRTDPIMIRQGQVFGPVMIVCNRTVKQN